MKPSAEYLISKTSAEDLTTSLQIQTQTFGRISRFSAESLNPRQRVTDMRPEIWNSERSQILKHLLLYSFEGVKNGNKIFVTQQIFAIRKKFKKNSKKIQKKIQQKLNFWPTDSKNIVKIHLWHHYCVENVQTRSFF